MKHIYERYWNRVPYGCLRAIWSAVGSSPNCGCRKTVCAQEANNFRAGLCTRCYRTDLSGRNPPQEGTPSRATPAHSEPGAVGEGQHPARSTATHRECPTEAPPSPLAGKLFDENGEPLYVQGAVKGASHYRYYVSRGLVRGSLPDDQRGWRVAAPELERAVRAAAQKILGDRAAIADAIQELSIDARDRL